MPCISLLISILAVPLAAGSGVVVQREAYLMGTRVSLSAVDESRAAGLGRVERALAALEAAEAELSTWISGSNLSRLNRATIGEAVQVDRPLCEVLKDVWAWQRETDAAFDPAIGGLLDAWGVHRGGRVPSAEELSSARARSGLHLFDFRPGNCVVIRRADASIDAGAFGKGEALDRAARVLGEGAWMIDLGGQVSARGGPPDEAGWPVAIAHPIDRGRAYLSVRLATGSLATSGGSERDANVGARRIGHILDPRTGDSARFRGSVTVWHERAVIADILSTALFVMGPERGLPWAEARGLRACFLEADANGGVRARMTAAFQTGMLSSEQ